MCLYTVRVPGSSFQPRVYAAVKYSVKIGRNKPDLLTISDLEPQKPR